MTCVPSLFLLSLSPLTTLPALVASLSLPSFPPFLDIDTLPFPFYEYNSDRTWLRTSHTALPVKLWVNQAATVGAGEFIPYLYRPSYAGAAVSNRCRNISSEGFGADVVGGLGLGRGRGQRAGAFYIWYIVSREVTEVTIAYPGRTQQSAGLFLIVFIRL